MITRELVKGHLSNYINKYRDILINKKYGKDFKIIPEPIPPKKTKEYREYIKLNDGDRYADDDFPVIELIEEKCKSLGINPKDVKIELFIKDYYDNRMTCKFYYTKQFENKNYEDDLIFYEEQLELYNKQKEFIDEFIDQVVAIEKIINNEKV